MAAQQTMIAETIRGMKLAMRRRDNDSDSDTSITQPTNRGNKLKRKAHNVREGRLDNTQGRSYKKRIDYAGYSRHIIHDNPLRFDEDGDLIDEEDHDQDSDQEAQDDNPWAETKLHELLAPLTSAADLADHPSLSVPFTSRPLTEMADNARQAMHRERETLWHIKQLLLRLRGDNHWVPLSTFETEHDHMLLDPDASMTDEPALDLDQPLRPDSLSLDQPLRPDALPEPEHALPNQQEPIDGQQEPINGQPEPSSPTASALGLQQHAMTTRAQARTSPSPRQDGFPSPSPAPSSVPSIHGFFHIPASALPDRDYGLPASEADDTRRLLLLYCQKQEQIVRESELMLEGLLRADRLRKHVWRWCKAEAHRDEMSDGEDWYDKDEWNLGTDLVKGKEEEEIEEEGRGAKGRRRRGAQH